MNLLTAGLPSTAIPLFAGLLDAPVGVAHYLVVDPTTRTVLHFDRANWQQNGSRLGEEDVVELKPPGISLPVRRCFSFT